MKKNLILLCFCLILLACKKQNKDDIYNKFIINKSLYHHKLLDGDNHFFGRPSKVFYKDSIIVVWDQMKELFFSLIDLKKNVCIGEFGKKGQAPNEFLQPFGFQFLNDSLISIYDVWKRELIGLNIHQWKENIENHPVIMKDTSRCYTIVPTIYNNYVGLGPFRDGLLKLIDSEGRCIDTFFEYPYKDDAERKIPNHLRAMAYQGKLISNPAKDKIVYAIAYAPIISFFKVQEKSIKRIKDLAFDYPTYIPEEKGDAISAAMSRKDKNGFIDAYGTDRYVYVAYSGKSFEDYQERSFESDDIFVFDWKGNPVIHYKLDIPIVNFCVSPDDNNIYAFSYMPEPVLVHFQIERL